MKAWMIYSPRAALPLLALLLSCAAHQKQAVAPPLAATPDNTGRAPLPVPVPIPAVPLQTPPPMQVISLPNPSEPIVSIRLVFHAGSIDDPRGKEGLTALTVALLSQGGTRELSSSQLLGALYPMAARISASTNKEFTVFAGRVHQERLDRYFQILGDVLLEPRLDPRDFERLRTDAINTVKNYLRGEDDETLGKVGLDAVLYQNHPYAHFHVGTVQGLSAITLEDVKAHWKKLFTQDRLVIGLAGPVDSALEQKVKARFAALPATGAARIPLPPAPGFRGRTLILQKDTLSTAISMGYAYPLRRGHPDFYPVAFALSYLGEHRQSHGVLFNELREKRGLNYGDYAYAEHFQQAPGGSQPEVNVGRTEQDFSIWIRPVEQQNALFATRTALANLKQLIDKPAPTEAFETARGFLIGYTHLWELTAQRRLGFAIDDAYYGTHGFLEGYRKAMAALTPEQVQQAVKRHLALEKLNFVFVAKDGKGLSHALATQAPSPISYPTPKPPEVLEADKQLATFPLPMHPALIEVIEAQSFMEK